MQPLPRPRGDVMDVAHLQEELRGRAFLYDDPETAYLAGVRDAVAALAEEPELAEEDQAGTG